MPFSFVKTEPGADPIVVEGFFAASPQAVFHAWTEPSKIMKWFGKSPNSLFSATVDLRPGGIWQFLHSKTDQQSVGFEGTYLEIETNQRLVYSWSHVITHANGEKQTTPLSTVEVTFSAKGAGTDIRLVHSAIKSDDARRGVGGGWDAAFHHLAELIKETLD